MVSLIDPINLLIFGYIFFSFIAFLIYTFFHLATSYRYYNIKQIHRNWLLVILFLILLAVSNVIVGLYTYRVNILKDDSEYLLFLLAGYNLFIAIDIYIWDERYKERLLLVKYYDEIKEKVINKIDNEILWKNALLGLESFNKTNNLLNDDKLYPLVIIMKYKQRAMTLLPIPNFIKKHSNFPNFKLEVYRLRLEKILEQMEIDIT